MARIWQEGFEDGLPYDGYLEGNPNSNYISEISLNDYPNYMRLSSGRNLYSQKSLQMYNSSSAHYIAKTLQISKSELYFRIYFKYDITFNATRPFVSFIGEDSNAIMYISSVSATDTANIYVRLGGTATLVANITLATNTWFKLDFYLKINSSTGAYEFKLNDVSIVSSSSVNTGTSNIKTIKIGPNNGSWSANSYYDDIALNDSSGSVNNSWCGNGTIVSLKPKGTGNKSQWDTCEGYAKAEDGTSTTNIEITGHGLSTNDVVYNKTRDAYRIVTVVDANNLTVSSVTSQTQNDIILLYKNVATITATTGTTANLATIAGHTMQSGDVIVNTTRSNAIRKVVYVSGNNVYNFHSTSPLPSIGSQVTSQASGDSIKTFAFTPYAITNHYEAVSNQTDPSPKLSYIKSTTSGDIDTFDMEELVADKALPASSTIVAVSHNIYAQEAGAGSQIKPVFRISSTDYEGTAQTLSSGTLQYQQIYETSPATSSAWSRSEIDGLEAGVKLV